VPTCRDIIDALLRPGRDPRTDLPGRRVWDLEAEGLTYEAHMQPGQEPAEVIDVLRRTFAQRVAAANYMLMERAHGE
jgi:hypothetical protein